MVIGTDIVNTGGKTILGLCASYTPYISQYYTKIATHDLPSKEKSGPRKTKDEKEVIVTERRSQIMCNFINEALANYSKKNNGPLPE